MFSFCTGPCESCPPCCCPRPKPGQRPVGSPGSALPLSSCVGGGRGCVRAWGLPSLLGRPPSRIITWGAELLTPRWAPGPGVSRGRAPPGACGSREQSVCREGRGFSGQCQSLGHILRSVASRGPRLRAVRWLTVTGQWGQRQNPEASRDGPSVDGAGGQTFPSWFAQPGDPSRTRAAEATPDLSFITGPLSRRREGASSLPQRPRESPQQHWGLALSSERSPDVHGVHPTKPGSLSGGGEGQRARAPGRGAARPSRGSAAAGRQRDGPECQGDERGWPVLRREG